MRVEAASLVGTAIQKSDVPSCIDELPVLAVAAASARGRTTIEGAEELRVKESDRIATVAAMLRAWGVSVEERPDGMVIEGIGGGAARMRGARIDSHGDHRIAMAAAVGALVASDATIIDGAHAAVISFPRFFEQLAEACA
jgi:3-phosphoshikimate 1-carboxyvinyltransferase